MTRHDHDSVDAVAHDPLSTNEARGRAHFTSVAIGPADEAYTVVDRGLDDGDAVAVQPSDLLTDGAHVTEVKRRGV